MTDTGQVPGEGLPENAGGHPGQPHPAAVTSPADAGLMEQQGMVPPPEAYGYAEPAPAEDDDLLLPGSQGAWEHAAPQPQAHLQPQQASQATLGAAHTAAQPAPAAPLPPQPGDHETGGRDSGSVDFTAVRQGPAPAPQQAPTGTPPRRPLHMGPPVPDATGGVVRSLADRGPATTPVRHPGPPTVGPEYLDIPTDVATDLPAEAPQAPENADLPAPGPQAHHPHTAQPYDTGHHPAPDVSQAYAEQTADQVAYADQTFAPQVQGGPSATPDEAPLPGPQLGEIPTQVPPWGEASAQAAAMPIAEPVAPGAGWTDGAAESAPEGGAVLPDEAVPAEPAAAGSVAARADGASETAAAGEADVTSGDASSGNAVSDDAVSDDGADAVQAVDPADAAQGGASAEGEGQEAPVTAEAVAAPVAEAEAGQDGEQLPDGDAAVPQPEPTVAEHGAEDGPEDSPRHETEDGPQGPETVASEAADEAGASEPVAAEAVASEAVDEDAAPTAQEQGHEQVAGQAAEEGEGQAVDRTVPAPAPSQAGAHPEIQTTPEQPAEQPDQAPESAQPDQAAPADAAAPTGTENTPAAATDAEGGTAAEGSTEDAGSTEGAESAQAEQAAQDAEVAENAAPTDAAPATDGQADAVPADAPAPGAAHEQPAVEAQEQPAAAAPEQPAADQDPAAAPAPEAPEAVATPEAAATTGAPEDTEAPEAVQATEAEEPRDAEEPAEAEQPAVEAQEPAEAQPATPATDTAPAAADVQAADAQEHQISQHPEPQGGQDAPAAGTVAATTLVEQPVADPTDQPTGVQAQPSAAGTEADAEAGTTEAVPQDDTAPAHAADTDEQPEAAATTGPEAQPEGPTQPDSAHRETAPETAPETDHPETAPETPDDQPDTQPLPPAAQPPATAPAAGYDDSERAAVHRVMRERRDIRNGFRGDPIPNDVLLRVLEAAHTAPSVGHSQPWDFVVIRSAETRERMHQLAMAQRDAYAKSLPKARAKQFRELKIEAILETPVNIVVTADPTRGGRHTLGRHTQPQMAPYSSALAVENLWLAARAEGLGVGWVSFFDEREMVRELGLPEHLEVVAYLCVGYVDEFPDEPELMQAGWAKRRPLSWVVHEETYGRRALPGEDPHDLLQETLQGIRPLDAKALGDAWERQKRMTKPAGALGMLEIISAQLCGLSRKCPPPIPEPAAVAIFAGDHGVHAQGVTPWPQEVTGQMVANFLGGGAVCNAFANQVGAEVCIVDVGVAAELPATPGLLPRKVRPGTADFTQGPAMSHEEVLKAIEVGIETARDLVAAGNKALLTGEMGIANTTASAALIAVYTDVDPAEVTGRGTGINDETHARKVDVVRRALELHQPDPADPIGTLAAVGGLEHAALVGLILGGASLRTPVLLDGVSAGAAALVARAIAPEALAACIAGHRSAEPGHVAALTKLGLRPLVDLDLRLGEGTGALLALPVVQSAARAMHEVATFDSAGVTEKN